MSFPSCICVSRQTFFYFENIFDDLFGQSNLAQDAGAGLENTEKTLPDLAGFLASVDAAPDTSLLVVVDNRGGLGMVGGQSLLQGCGVVVGALNQGLAGDVVLHVLLGRVEDLVI